MFETKICEAPGCGKATREKKPFCSNHVEMHPYVQKLLKEMARQAAEHEQLRETSVRHVPVDSLTVREIINHIELHGSRTIERLARELNLKVEIVEHYINTLVSRGVLKRGRTRRGNTIVSLVDERGANSAGTRTDP